MSGSESVAWKHLQEPQKARRTRMPLRLADGHSCCLGVSGQVPLYLDVHHDLPQE